MTRPTVSVIIAAHPARARNGMLQAAINSVLEQTRLPDAIHVAMDNDREGAAATRQRALMAASTDFTAVLDSDDLLLPKHLEWLLRHQEETGADLCYAWFKVLQQFADGSTRILEGDENGDGVFPLSHYLNPFDPADPIETTITVLVRTELAQQVGYKELDRGEANTGEDRYFTLACLEAGAKISHLVRKSWLYRHHQLPGGVPGNSSGFANRGDARLG
jgi:glycosyltransferase involved in cell wall biosynthesis